MSTLMPVSRSTMRKLHAQKEAEEHAAHFERIVGIIYRSAQKVATASSKEKQFSFLCPGTDAFYKPKTVADLIKTLQRLFPDCSIERTNEGTHGFYLTVDWS